MAFMLIRAVLCLPTLLTTPSAMQLNFGSKQKVATKVFEWTGELTDPSGCAGTEGANADLPLGDVAYTIEGLIAPTGSSGGIFWYGKKHAGSQMLGMRISGCTTITVEWWGHPVLQAFNVPTMCDGGDHHIVSTYDPSTLERTIHLDGSLVQTDSMQGKNKPLAVADKSTFCIGDGRDFEGTLFRGTIKGVRIWKGVTSPGTWQAGSGGGGGGGSGGSAVGDPHVRNADGLTFEIKKAGVHTMVLVPRGADPVGASLRVDARVAALGSLCGPKFIQQLGVSGKWLGQAATLDFSSGDGPLDTPMKIGLRVGGSRNLTLEEFLSAIPPSMVQVRTAERAMENLTRVNQHATILSLSLRLGLKAAVRIDWVAQVVPKSARTVNSLWLYAHGLSETVGSIGGLLGSDSHLEAATAPEGCPQSEGALLLRSPAENSVIARAE